jgi:hypothetical protein
MLTLMRCDAMPMPRDALRDADDDADARLIYFARFRLRDATLTRCCDDAMPMLTYYAMMLMMLYAMSAMMLSAMMRCITLMLICLFYAMPRCHD